MVSTLVRTDRWAVLLNRGQSGALQRTLATLDRRNSNLARSQFLQRSRHLDHWDLYALLLRSEMIVVLEHSYRVLPLYERLAMRASMVLRATLLRDCLGHPENVFRRHVYPGANSEGGHEGLSGIAALTYLQYVEVRQLSFLLDIPR